MGTVFHHVRRCTQQLHKVYFSAKGSNFSSYPPSYYGAEYNPNCTATWPPSVMTEIFVHAANLLFVTCRKFVIKLDEHVKQLEEASTASTSSADNFSDEDNSVLPPALQSLTREQKLTIDMILSSKGSWTVVM